MIHYNLKQQVKITDYKEIDNTNRNQLSIPTTNSDIVSSDTRNYIVNQFGAVYFTQQLPTPSLVGGPPPADK